MKLSKFIAAFGIMIIAATSVNAQTTANRSDKIKINQGVKSGELTKKETVRLARQQKDISQDVKSAKADGVVTREERKNIKKEKRKADRTIYRKKHNNRDRN
jgi:hypothetical protein